MATMADEGLRQKPGRRFFDHRSTLRHYRISKEMQEGTSSSNLSQLIYILRRIFFRNFTTRR